VPSVLIVAAHPDDEILGAGIWLHRHKSDNTHILHTTDGSPRDRLDAREAYAATRRNELQAALHMIDFPASNCHQFNYTDKESYLHLIPLITKLRDLIQQLQPSLVFSPAYEGGHPDHDAAAFAVALACKTGPPFRHIEFPLYHAGADGEMITSEFLPHPAANAVETLELSHSERTLKARMLACFATQSKILSHFHLDHERLREAPPYDFTQPPHPGPLLYELWGWNISGDAWRENARHAMTQV